MNINKYPLISIVTPSFNQGQFIERTINSVLDQTYPNLEYFVIDGGSKDKTVNILKKYNKQITRWVSEKDNGQADAINKGMAMAKGEILAFLNSDDVYLPNALNQVVNFFIQNPDKSIVVGKGKLIDENDKDLGDYHNAPMDWSKPQPTCSICQPAVFWRKRVYDQVGQINVLLHYIMDYEYWLRISKIFTFFYIPSYLAVTRSHKLTKTETSQVELAKEMVHVQKEFYGRVQEAWIFQLASEKVLLTTFNKKNHEYYRRVFLEAFKGFFINRTWPSRAGLKKLVYFLKNILT